MLVPSGLDRKEEARREGTHRCMSWVSKGSLPDLQLRGSGSRRRGSRLPGSKSKRGVSSALGGGSLDASPVGRYRKRGEGEIEREREGRTVRPLIDDQRNLSLALGEVDWKPRRQRSKAVVGGVSTSVLRLNRLLQDLMQRTRRERRRTYAGHECLCLPTCPSRPAVREQRVSPEYARSRFQTREKRRTCCETSFDETGTEYAWDVATCAAAASASSRVRAAILADESSRGVEGRDEEQRSSIAPKVGRTITAPALSPHEYPLDACPLITPPSTLPTYTTRMSLSTPDVFPFPYATPYPIQLQLMQHIYHTLEHSHLAIVQSPTGTVRPPSPPPLLSSSLSSASAFLLTGCLFGGRRAKV